MKKFYNSYSNHNYNEIEEFIAKLVKFIESQELHIVKNVEIVFRFLTIIVHL